MPNVSEDSEEEDDLGVPTKRAELKNLEGEEHKMGLRQNSSKKLKRKTKHNAEVELPPDDYEILFQQQTENPRLK
jgi:hypothetical protein